MPRLPRARLGPLLGLGLGGLGFVRGPQPAGLQDETPVLRARAATLDVIDGGHLRRGYWTADPALPLDVYEARRSSVPRRIEFRSDLGSLTLDVAPGTTRDFVIELEGGGRCATRVSARRLGAVRSPGASGELPFRLGADGKLHVEGRIGDSEPLDLMFDTGADTPVLYPSGVAKVPGLRVDGTQQNAGFSGVVRRATSSGNRLTIGGFTWEDESVLIVEEDVDHADGIVGWVLFEDLILALDPAAGRGAVVETRPEPSAGGVLLPLEYHGSLPYVALTLGLGGRSVAGLFVLDTGSSASLHVEAEFARRHDLVGTLATLGTSRSGGLGGGRVTNDVVRLPELSLGGLTLADVPIHLPRSGGAPRGTAGTLGMDVLRHFDLVLDARSDVLELRPGAAHAEPFRRDYFPRAARRALQGVGLLALVVGAVALRRLLRARRLRASRP